MVKTCPFLMVVHIFSQSFLVDLTFIDTRLRCITSLWRLQLNKRRVSHRHDLPDEGLANILDHRRVENAKKLDLPRMESCTDRSYQTPKPLLFFVRILRITMHTAFKEGYSFFLFLGFLCM